MSENIPFPNLNDLLESGVHFGHKASRWNPKMAPYIYSVRNNCHRIDLRKTMPLFKKASRKIYEVAKKNGKILFVGTKPEASAPIKECAEGCGQFFVNSRWLGGTITNWRTINSSIKKLDEIEKLLDNPDALKSHTKKEVLLLNRKYEKLVKYFGGIRDLGNSPDLIVVMSTHADNTAIKEAQKKSIPVIAIVDTNSNPDGIEYPIPGNDDSKRTNMFYCKSFLNAALEGIKVALAESSVDIKEIEDAKDVRRIIEMNKKKKNKSK